MSSPRYTEDDQEWMDPNLSEPKLQDELDHRLGLNRRNRQRPRAAYGLKSAPEQPQRRQTEITQIRYYKYVPYRGMSEPEKQKYLSLGPARLTSSRTAPPQTKATPAASFWPSASRAKSLKVYDYHLAELSMTYRSPPSLLDQPRRQLTTPTMSPRPQYQNQEQAPPLTTQRRPLFFQLHSSRGVPASAPSATQQELQQASIRHVAENGTQVSRGNTPFIDSALSDYPTEPRDVVSKSDSNRLLNVVSVDECHVRHRRRRRRMRRVQENLPPPAGEEVADVDAEAWEQQAGEEDEEEEFDEEEEEGDAGDNAAVESFQDGVENQAAKEHLVTQADNSRRAPTDSIVIHAEQPETATEVAALPTVLSAPTTRPATERSGGGGRRKRRTDKEMRKIAAAKFLRRNEILREKMAIYLDWKLNQERMGLIELRLGNPATRFERFTMELVQQEALVANQFRDGGGGGNDRIADVAATRMSHDESPQFEAQSDSATNFLRFSRQATIGSQRQELSLTEMYDALNA